MGQLGEAHVRDAAPRTRGPRLARAVAAPPEGTAVGGVVLVLPGGGPAPGDTGLPLSPLPYLRSYARYARMRPLARSLAAAGAAEGLVVHVVRYGRPTGGTGPDAPHVTDAVPHVADAEWAVNEVVRRYGDVPVCLAGHGTGGRAALRAAGHQAVNSVLAMAPCLPAAEDRQDAEPVRQLVGRQVLIMHGTNDAHTDPRLSFRLAERAKKANRDTCRFEVHSDGHALRQHHAEVLALASDFMLGALLSRTYSRPVADALAAPPPLGLRMPLAAGFGRSLRP
ncbi:alpha/beta hydrolase [Streptomyces paludis]|uniref:Alpha/beta hydrolase n=1 Tax=Streptomyces paludis TaxID=2282738 RepID=A0A345HT88_9ACTN|nr:alpha/beta hydrolase [Streptomyces paludis]AXG79912.1 alpha/beta hydrolase [Streptomyces paludis]